MQQQMGVIATNKRELNLYYNPNSSVGMQTLAFVEASKYKVLAVDLTQTKVTGTQWAELAERLDKPIKALINTDHPDFIHAYGKNHDLESDDDWLKVLANNPNVVTQPILVHSDQALQVSNPAMVLEFLEKQ